MTSAVLRQRDRRTMRAIGAMAAMPILAACLGAGSGAAASRLPAPAFDPPASSPTSGRTFRRVFLGRPGRLRAREGRQACLGRICGGPTRHGGV